MIDPLAMDKIPDNVLKRQREADIRTEDGARFWLTDVAGDARFIKRQGGPTDERPNNPLIYEMYFDADKGIPIWWDGSDWVDATGAGV
jgi:hypothetical protein